MKTDNPIQTEKPSFASNEQPLISGNWFHTVKTNEGWLAGLKFYDDVIYYPLPDCDFQPKARAVLMDLDGTTVKSEEFWIWIIEKTICALLKNPSFRLQYEDIPYVSGHTTADHLNYCIKKYGTNETLQDALALYHAITEQEMKNVLSGTGNSSAFIPREGLKEFLLTLKANGIKIGLATSGLDYKAIPEIVSAFRTIGLGDPTKFYDAIITGGQRKLPGQYGTLGELAAKPHPWIYSELGRIGLSCPPLPVSNVIGIEDSAAGVVSLRLAGYPVLAFNDGNVSQSNLDSLCKDKVDTFEDILKIIL